MARHRLLIASITSIAIVASAAASSAPQAEAKGPASAAAAASPALIGELTKAIGATPEQAAGAAGALFGVAKSQLSPADFAQVHEAVPGMDALLKAAPALGGGSQMASLSQLAGGAGSLASVASAFSKLGLKPEMVSPAVGVLTSFVTKSGGPGVGNLLAGVLK